MERGIAGYEAARSEASIRKLAIGDGALGFWKALPQVFGTTREQRCWVHKTANVLNKLPKHLQPKAKSTCTRSGWPRPRGKTRISAFDHVRADAMSRSIRRPPSAWRKIRTRLLAFYDFPAEHWIHMRTTNPIESTFATVRLRTAKTRGCVSRASILSMVFKLTKSAELRWRNCVDAEMHRQVITGVQFKNGVEVQRRTVKKIAA